MIYTHITTKKLESIQSPQDQLALDENRWKKTNVWYRNIADLKKLAVILAKSVIDENNNNLMKDKKNILAIIGSASANSANLKLVERIASLTENEFNLTIYNDLISLLHFDPVLSADNPPKELIELWNTIEKSDGIINWTPEYVFSIPSGLKNAIEWWIASTV